MMSTVPIPVNFVARVTRMKVKNEEDAAAVDALVPNTLSLLKTVPGFHSFTRMVCKSEFDYEATVVFEAAHFQAFMESDFRTEKILPELAKAAEYAVDGKVHQQNFVYDQYQ